MTDLLHNETSTLDWGQTPWDSMTREQLIRTCTKMYIALVSAQGVMNLARRHASPSDLFWYGPNGVGGHALDQVSQALAGYHHDNIYRTTTRYIEDLLFENNAVKWYICKEHGILIGQYIHSISPFKGARPSPACTACDKQTRPIQWSDFNRKDE